MARKLQGSPGGGGLEAPCFDPRRSGGVGAEPPRAASAAPSAAVAAPPVAQLDSLETTAQRSRDSLTGWCPDFDRNWDSLPFQHRGWHDTRCRILRTMNGLDISAARVWRFARCGDDVHVYQDGATGEVEFHSSACRDRWCLICGQRRSAEIARSLEKKMAEAETRFITLTIRGKHGDFLSDQIARLRQAWRELRRHPFWKEHVSGGAVMLEVKWSTGVGGHWHPHYHILCHGKWLDQERLRAVWFGITGDSDQVKVKLVREAKEALAYVTKYASKPVDSSFVNNQKRLGEAMLALKGQRLAACFGTWYGTPLKEEFDDDETPPFFTNWVYMGTIESLRHRSREGDKTAAVLLDSVERIMRIRSLANRQRDGPSASDDAADTQRAPS